jgi:hypothetical protein
VCYVVCRGNQGRGCVRVCMLAAGTHSPCTSLTDPPPAQCAARHGLDLVWYQVDRKGNSKTSGKVHAAVTRDCLPSASNPAPRAEEVRTTRTRVPHHAQARSSESACTSATHTFVVGPGSAHVVAELHLDGGHGDNARDRLHEPRRQTRQDGDQAASRT